MKRNIILLIAFGCLFSLSACKPVIDPAQPTQSDLPPIDPETTVGQTLLATYRGLSGIAIYLVPQTELTGVMRLHLRNAPDDPADAQTVDVSVDKIKKPQFVSFDFSPQNDSFKKYYYFYLELIGSGQLDAAKAPGNTYSSGAMYVDQASTGEQLSFRLKYDRYQVLLGVIVEAVSWIWLSLLAVLLYIIPGWALLSVTLSTWSLLHWGEKIGLSAAASLAFYPILLLWTNLIGAHLGRFYTWLPVVAGIILIIWNNRKRLASFSLKMIDPRDSIPDLALIGLIVMILGVRFWAIRTLDAPMWGDSYQHSMISQLLVDHKGLFTSWEPYANLTTFTYHFGFHSSVAAFYWLAHQNMSQSVLWVGQILNVLAVISLYPLSRRIAHNSWAGVFTVLIAGLLSPMPMFFTNWGRYTQLAGLVILPGLIFLLLSPPKKEANLKGNIVALSILLAGLALTHYRVLIFGAAFIIVYLLYPDTNSNIKVRFLNLFWAGLIALIIFIPWLINIAPGKVTVQIFRNLGTSANDVSQIALQNNSIGNITYYFPLALWIITLLAVAYFLWQRNRMAGKLVAWSALVFLISNPYLLKLPGTGITNNFAMLISAYLPNSILLGGFISCFTKTLDISKLPNPHKGWELAILVAVLLVGGWGVIGRFEDIQPTTFGLVTRPDIRAVNWIDSHIPEGGRFLVNSFLAFNNRIAVGSDAGWWLPLLANRQTNLPPINYIYEKNADPQAVQIIRTFTEQINNSLPELENDLAFLKNENLSYVYIGQKQGHVNFGGLTLDPYQLLTSDHFQLLYHQDRVWIFKILY